MGSLTVVMGHLQTRWLRRAPEIACASGGFVAGLLVAAHAGWMGAGIDAIRLGAAVVGSTLGASLGILGARALSRDSDGLATLRRVNAIVLKTSTLERWFDVYIEHLEELEKKLSGIAEADRVKTITTYDVGHTAFFVLSLDRLGSDPPNFDGVLESDADVRAAAQVTNAFNLARGITSNPDDWRKPTEAARISLAHDYDAIESYRNTRAGLKECQAHFETKAKFLRV